ncbi:MAG: DUF2460 domain-containing protein [Pseudomonadota bacterium]
MSLENFHDVRLPMSIAFGAQGGPERRTEIVPLASGGEARNAVWSGSRRRWELGGANTTIDSLRELISFFEARRGPLHGFRFRDIVDDRTASVGEAISSVDQEIGVGDGNKTVFELSKRYGDTVRRIWKPVAGSVRVAIDGTETSDGVVVDINRGEVRFPSPPAVDAVVTAGFVFDVPVRFDADRIETSLDGFGAGHAVQVPIIELLT